MDKTEMRDELKDVQHFFEAMLEFSDELKRWMFDEDMAIIAKERKTQLDKVINNLK